MCPCSVGCRFGAGIAASLFVALAAGQLPLVKHGRRPQAAPSLDQNLLPLAAPTNGKIQVDLTASHVLNKFEPALAFGAGVDAIGAGSESTLFSAANVKTMLSAGEGSLSYRLYTELNVQDWHWNPTGTWSDAKNSQGYFTGGSVLGGQIQHSYGYFLPHRGSTYDYGSNLKYSNIDDGDLTTYWKSNPYLTSNYTHVSDSLHPQWLLFILSSTLNVDAVQIHWANPYAVSYEVQYWTGDDPIFDPINGKWVTFPLGAVTGAKGGLVTRKVANSPIATQFVRILMTQSSNTYDTHGAADIRNRMGYAVYEAGVGAVDSKGNFTDFVVHSPSQNQTTVYASSTDPWHSATNENSDTEQIGLDSILAGALSQNLPAMVAAPMIYSTPQNAVAEVGYLVHRHYPLIGIELGEEPDGQYMTPEDYAALYVQWAAAIHASYPQVKVGGPVTSYNGVQTWPDAAGDTDFLRRFVNYLEAHGGLSSLGFVSTEHYPFYQAVEDWTLVNQEVGRVQSLATWVANAHVPKTVPVYVTEYNLSAAPDEPIVDLLGALWHTVFVGEFMKRGGAGSFFYQYLPYEVSSGGTSYGLIGMLASDDSDQVVCKTSEYFSSQMISQEWCLPGKGSHSVLPATSSITDSGGNVVVLPYAVYRPDGNYALMLVNTDSAAHSVTLSFTDTKAHYFTGTVAQAQFSSKDYVWVSNGLNSIANPDGPYEHATVASGSTALYALPAHSLTVLRGKIK